MWHVTRSLLSLLAPVLCFTADEPLQALTGEAEDSPVYHTWCTSCRRGGCRALGDALGRAARPPACRSSGYKTLREAGAVGSSLQAEVDIEADAGLYPLLNAG